MNMRLIGLRLKEIRNKRGITSDHLAEECGLSPSFIRQLEIGKRGVSLEAFITLCNVLQTSPDYLLQDQINWQKDSPFQKLDKEANNLTVEQLHLLHVIIETMIADNGKS